MRAGEIAFAGIKVIEVVGMPAFSRDSNKRVNSGRAADDQRQMSVATVYGQLHDSSCDEQYAAFLCIQRVAQCPEGGTGTAVMMIPLVVTSSQAIAKETATSTATALEGQADADPEPNPPAPPPARPENKICEELLGKPRPKPEDFTDPADIKKAKYEACVWDADCIRQTKLRAAANKAKTATVSFGVASGLAIVGLVAVGICTGGVGLVAALGAATVVGGSGITAGSVVTSSADDIVAANAAFEIAKNACWKQQYAASTGGGTP